MLGPVLGTGETAVIKTSYLHEVYIVGEDSNKYTHKILDGSKCHDKVG